MPWWLIVALLWAVIAWFVALLVGRFFGLNSDTHHVRSAPPAHPRARLVLDRDRAGHVEIKPSVRSRG